MRGQQKREFLDRLCARREPVIIFIYRAPVAQLDRASGYEPEGREFESPRARHFLLSCHRFLASSYPMAGGAASAPALLPPSPGRRTGRGELSALLICVLFWLELTFQLQTHENAVQVTTAAGLSRWT